MSPLDLGYAQLGAVLRSSASLCQNYCALRRMQRRKGRKFGGTSSKRWDNSIFLPRAHRGSEPVTCIARSSSHIGIPLNHGVSCNSGNPAALLGVVWVLHAQSPNQVSRETARSEMTMLSASEGAISGW